MMTTPLRSQARLSVLLASVAALAALSLLTAGLDGASPPVRPAAPALPADHAAKMARGRELFVKNVRQVLTDRCVKCHGGGKTRGGLDLTSREALLKGSDKGPVLVPGKSKESKLY